MEITASSNPAIREQNHEKLGKYELYCSMNISGAGGIDKGDMQEARAYPSRFPNKIVLDCEAEI